MNIKRVYIGPSGSGKSTAAVEDAKADPEGFYLDLGSLEGLVGGSVYGKRNLYITITSDADVSVEERV